MVGFVLAGLGTVALIYGLAETASHGDLLRIGSGGAVLAGVVLLAAFVRESLRSPAPLLDLTLFRERTYAAVTHHRARRVPRRCSRRWSSRRCTSRSSAVRTRPAPGCWSPRSRSAWRSSSAGPDARPTATAAAWCRVIGLLVGTLSLLPFITFDEHTSYLLTIVVNVVRGIGFGALGMPLFAVAFALSARSTPAT